MTDKLSPGHMVIGLPPHLIQDEPCPFLYMSNRCLAGLPRDCFASTLPYNGS